MVFSFSATNGLAKPQWRKDGRPPFSRWFEHFYTTNFDSLACTAPVSAAIVRSWAFLSTFSSLLTVISHFGSCVKRLLPKYKLHRRKRCTVRVCSGSLLPINSWNKYLPNYTTLTSYAVVFLIFDVVKAICIQLELLFRGIWRSSSRTAAIKPYSRTRSRLESRLLRSTRCVGGGGSS